MPFINYTPPEWVIEKMGTTYSTAKALGVSFSSVAHWLDTGRIPSTHHVAILNVAASEDLDIKPADLVVGRKLEA